MEKCTFDMSEVQYLSYIIDEHGMHVDPTKIKSHLGLASPNHSNGASQLFGPCKFLSEVHVGIIPYHLAFKSN